MKYSFPKSEKLCGQLRIKSLYSDGHRFVAWPLRVTYKQIGSSESPLTSERATGDATVLIWAPKSLFKHAVDRNHMRRLMREAYRLNSEPLKGTNLQIAFNYIDKEQQPYAVIEKAMKKAIRRITDDLKS